MCVGSPSYPGTPTPPLFQEFFVGYHTHTSAAAAAAAAAAGGGAGGSAAGPSGSSSGSGNMWLDTYFMRPSMVPTFLTPLLADRALVIGKSINFIRLCIQKATSAGVARGPAGKGKGKGRDPRRGRLLPGMARPSVADALGFGRAREEVDFERMRSAASKAGTAATAAAASAAASAAAADAAAVDEGAGKRELHVDFAPPAATAAAAAAAAEEEDEDEDDRDLDVLDGDGANLFGSSVAYSEVEASLQALRYGGR